MRALTSVHTKRSKKRIDFSNVVFSTSAGESLFYDDLQFSKGFVHLSSEIQEKIQSAKKVLSRHSFSSVTIEVRDPIVLATLNKEGGSERVIKINEDWAISLHIESLSLSLKAENSFDLDSWVIFN